MGNTLRELQEARLQRRYEAARMLAEMQCIAETLEAFGKYREGVKALG